MTEFPCRPTAQSAGRALRVMTLGRYSPAKRLEDLIEGVRLARDRDVDVRIDLFGTTGTPEYETYKRGLETLVATNGYREFVSVGGTIPRTGVPDEYERADVVGPGRRATVDGGDVGRADGAADPLVDPDGEDEREAGAAQLLDLRVDGDRLAVPGRGDPVQRARLDEVLRPALDQRVGDA